MSLVVETGSGDPAATSFVTGAQVVAYATDRGLAFPADAPSQLVPLTLSGDYLANEARLPYVGTRHTTAQRLPWPRDGASERGGRAIPSGTIPTRLMDAQCELAILSSAGIALQDDLDNGGLLVSKDTIDVLSTEYIPPQAFQILTGIPGETLKTTIIGFLSPILRPPGTRLISGTLLQPADESPYIPGQFDNQGIGVTSP